MTNSDQWAAAVLPPCYRVAGARLRPLTLGHLIVLSRFESPMVRQVPGFSGLGDLTLALWVCSRDWRNAFYGFDRPWGRLWRWWMAIVLEADFDRHLAGFTEWLGIQQQGPDLWIKDGSGGGSRGACSCCVLVVSLVKRLGLSWSDALDMPVAQALWAHWTAIEDDGLVQIVSDSEKAAADEAERLAADPEAIARLEAQFAHVLPKNRGAKA